MEKTMDKENDKKQDQHVDEGAKVNMQGHLLIRDAETGEELVNKRNAIHYGNMANNVANAMGGSATARDNARIYYMAFGNGGSSVDTSGSVLYKTQRVSESVESSSISDKRTTLDYLLTGINLVQANFERTTFNSKQRIESIKASLVSAVAGGVGFAPVGYIFYSDNLPQWEFSTDMASVESFLFGLVYRYATRDDENEHLKSGVIAAFVITRALSMVQPTDTCLTIPLRCGDLPFPLGYFDSNMLIMFGIGLVTSFATFFAASTALEFCFDNEYIERVES